MDYAPHAKTTMAPQLLTAQLDAGAWGLTVATPNQALALRTLRTARGCRQDRDRIGQHEVAASGARLSEGADEIDAPT